MVKKDTIRDYATEAFRVYALLGKPTAEELKEKLQNELLRKARTSAVMTSDAFWNKYVPVVDDIDAVDKTLEHLEKSKRDYIIKAVEAVYFVCPKRPLKKNELTERITAFSFSFGASERTVFYWLKEARSIFASFRGLSENIYESLQ